MTTNTEALDPCPFCGAGETSIVENGKMWTGKGWGAPASVSVRHFCTAVPGQPSRMIERVGRDEASAIAAWNTRAALSAQPQPAPLDTEALVDAICAERVGLIAKKHTGDKVLKLSEVKRLETLDAALSVLSPCVTADMWDELEASGKRADEREAYIAKIHQKYGIAAQPAPAETAQPVAPAGMTMDGMYGDGSDHSACELCGFCVTCGDCVAHGCGATPTAQPAPEAAQTALRSEDSAGVVALQAVPVVVTAPVFETEAYGCAVFKDGVWERIPAATPPQEGQP